jgi:hypothetical protein
MDAVGRLFDVTVAGAPVDFTTAGYTGNRVSLRNCSGVTFVALLAAAASGTEAVVFTLQQHTLAAGGSTLTLTSPNVRYYTKTRATALDGSEQWSAVGNPTAGVITIPGTAGQSGVILAVEIDDTTLSDTYAYVSMSAADPGTVSRLGAVIALPRDLDVKRRPLNLVGARS